MKRGNKKIINNRIYIIVGFFILYLVGMFLMTFLVKDQYIQSASVSVSAITKEIMAEVEDVQLIYNEDGTLAQYSRDYMQYILSKNTEYMSQHALLSVGLLDKEGNLIAETSDCFYKQPPTYVNNEPKFQLINLPFYFTENEMAMFREYYMTEAQKTYPVLDKGYVTKLAFDDDNNQLVHLYIKRTEERKNEDDTMEEITLDTIFRWENPEYAESELHHSSFEMPITYTMLFPYLRHGEQYWKRWKECTSLHYYFQGIEENDIIFAYNNRTYGKYENTFINRMYLGDNSEKNYEEPNYILVSNYKIYPWEAAVHRLQDIYIYSSCFVVLCTAIVIFFTDKTTKTQLQLEQTRRDFTNAAAHELKTPIAIVRNLFENMERETSETKNAYYRQEGIRQTELMDHLIKEMIVISKMDSDSLKLKNESISLLAVIEQQMKKLDSFIDEKNLHIHYWKVDDFLITGDRDFIEKAMFNLLENAVTYNRQDGKISIHIENNLCTIENTGEFIDEKNLPHVFDMFYTGNKSRNSAKKHTGLGLYLAKRIFEMHHLDITINNTDVGVKVTLQKC